MDNIITDSLQFVLSIQMIGRTDGPIIHKDTYDDLISTGNAIIIQKKELYNQVSSYYSNIPYEWFDEYIDSMWKGYLPLGIDALPLDFLMEILDHDFLIPTLRTS